MAPSSDLDIHCKLQIEVVSGQPAMDLRRWHDSREVSLAARLPCQSLQSWVTGVSQEFLVLIVRRMASLADQIFFCSFLYMSIC